MNYVPGKNESSLQLSIAGREGHPIRKFEALSKGDGHFE